MRSPTRAQTIRRRATAVGALVALSLVVVLILTGRSPDEPAARSRSTSAGEADISSADSSAPSPRASTTTPSTTTLTSPPPTPPTTTSTGRFRPAGASPTVVGAGPLTTYRVEVEDGSGVDPEGFALEVEAILSDPHGWSTVEGISLQRVAGPADAVVMLATPATTDLLCAPLQTAGQVSCAPDNRAVINLDRWLTGAAPARLDLAGYRRYVISHEFGHTLGYGHVDCPAPGAPAPVMMQQTYSIGDCAPNPWPVPDQPPSG